MSDMDEFKDTYFQECQELLSDLEEHFIAIEQNEHDGETLHAVFRAIHSIKGGAGAFGFEKLVGFSHSFETFLDLLRDGKLHLSADVIALCLKANDIIADMVGAAQHDEDLGPDFGRDVEVEIKNASGLNTPNTMNTLDVGRIDEIETGISPAAEQPQDASLDSDVMRAWKIEFKPYRALFERANEPLFLFRELSDIGTMRVHANVADVQDFVDFDPMEPCISWDLYLETMAPKERIAEVFEFVDLDCDLNISLVESDDVAPVSASDELDSMPESKPTGRAGTLDVDLSAFLDDDDDDFSVPVRQIVVEAAPQDPLLGEGLSAKSLFPSEPNKVDEPQLIKSQPEEPQPEELQPEEQSAGLLARNYVEKASALKPAP
ncbi:MAG: Hpt domain-containing protein [Rhizobiales bacterium]|nr:Hpt domain-containing protein [Hyphomicrobiales bacterium]